MVAQVGTPLDMARSRSHRKSRAIWRTAAACRFPATPDMDMVAVTARIATITMTAISSTNEKPRPDVRARLVGSLRDLAMESLVKRRQNAFSPMPVVFEFAQNLPVVAS